MTAPDRLTALIEAARRAELDLTADEWSEICYLAAHLGPGFRRDLASARDPTAESTDGPDAPPGAQPDPAHQPGGAEAPLQTVSNRSHLVAAGAGLRGPGGVLPAPIRSIPGRTRLARSFSPLKRNIESPTEHELDVPATVRRSADLGVLEPVMVSARVRWFSVVLLIDEAGSGQAWRQEARMLRRALEESGAFAGLKVRRFNSDSVPMRVFGETATSSEDRDGRELNDPTGRRAILVFSDCVGAGWADERVGGLLEGWSATSPVAVVNPLPQRMWSRCQPRMLAGEWLAGRPFRAGQPMPWRPARGGTGRGAYIPVLDLSVDSLRKWAGLVAGLGTGWTSGTALWASGARVDGAQHSDEVEDWPDSMSEDGRIRLRVERFRASASPQAFQLAMALSAAPLQEPVIRAFESALLGTDQATYWAEIMLSGLVYRIDTAGSDADASYDYESGLRQEFFTRMPRHRIVALLQDANAVISRELGGTPELVTLLMSNNLQGLRPADELLTRVSVEVLESFGGSYRAIASDARAALTALATEPGPGTSESGTSDTPPEDGDLVVTPNIRTTEPAAGRIRDTSRTTIRELPPRLHHFTGRLELLTNLRQELVDNPNRAAVLVPRALYGLGGVGKTALANEYAHRYGGEYDVVWWIPAEDPAEVRRSLVQLSRELRLPEKTDQSARIRDLFDALTSRYPKSSWLLIYDNATNPRQLRDLLPDSTTHGHVLITSRDPAWAESGTLLQVSKFARPESTELLKRRARDLSDADADRLANLLDDLPLALNHAAAWHDETGLGADEYISRYNAKMALLPETMLPEYPRPVGAAFGVSYDQLRERSLAAAQLLQLCSHFGPEAISIDMLWRGRFVADLPDSLRQRLRDRTALQRELREVSRYELIQYDLTRGRFQLHRLVQRLLRDALPGDQRQTTLLHAQGILAMANPGSPDEIPLADQAKHAELSPHILPSSIIEATDYEARKVVLDQIRYRYLVGDYEGSRDLARETVRMWENQHAGQDELLLLVKWRLATTLKASGDTAGSLELASQVYRTFRESPDYGEDHEHTLTSANSYASALRAAGRFSEALEIDRNNLEQHRRILRDDPATLWVANNYAVDLRFTGDFRTARQIDESIVEQWTEMFGTEHRETLYAISNLVRDLYCLGRYGEALTRQQEALKIQDAVVGPAHPHVLLARRTVAVLLRKLGRYELARERSEAIYVAYLARFPASHEHTLAAAMSLVNALREENKDRESLRRARSLGEATLTHYERSFPNHIFTYACMVNLALVLRKTGELSRARDLNEHALDRLSATLWENHPYVLSAATNLANDLAAAGNYEAARETSGRVLEASRTSDALGEVHPYTLSVMLNHALDLEAVGREQDGEDLLRQTVQLFTTVLGPDHPDTIAAQGRRRLDADIEAPPT